MDESQGLQRTLRAGADVHIAAFGLMLLASCLRGMRKQLALLARVASAHV